MRACVPLKATMLSVQGSTAYDPPTCSFKSAEEASLRPQSTAILSMAWIHPGAGVIFPWQWEAREGKAGRARGILEDLACPGTRHRLSNPDRRARAPISRHFFLDWVWLGVERFGSWCFDSFCATRVVPARWERDKTQPDRERGTRMPSQAASPCNGANGGWCVEFRSAILAHGGSVDF